MDPKTVEKMIEGEISIGQTPMEPGFSNVSKEAQKIRGDNAESKIPGEGVIFYDILFHVRTRDGISQVIINLEMQKREPVKYDVEMRGLFYGARAISSQLERDFTGQNYNEIKKVYSIWLVMQAKDNTIQWIHLTKDDILGENRWKNCYNILNVIVVRTKNLPDFSEGKDLHRLIGSIFLPEVGRDTRKNILQNEFEIDMESDGKELQGLMCNLGAGLYEDGMERGIEQGESRKLMDLICRKLKKEKTVEQIAEELEEDPPVVERMVSVARRFAPDYDLDKICAEAIIPVDADTGNP